MNEIIENKISITEFDYKKVIEEKNKQIENIMREKQLLEDRVNTGNKYNVTERDQKRKLKEIQGQLDKASHRLLVTEESIRNSDIQSTEQSRQRTININATQSTVELNNRLQSIEFALRSIYEVNDKNKQEFKLQAKFLREVATRFEQIAEHTNNKMTIDADYEII